MRTKIYFEMYDIFVLWFILHVNLAAHITSTSESLSSTEHTSEGQELMAQWDHIAIQRMCVFKFSLAPFQFSLIYFVCKLKASRCLFTFWQNAWMSHMAVCDLEDPVREMWTVRMFSLTEWWKRFSWALSQQSDGREDVVFFF